MALTLTATLTREQLKNILGFTENCDMLPCGGIFINFLTTFCSFLDPLSSSTGLASWILVLILAIIIIFLLVLLILLLAVSKNLKLFYLNCQVIVK